jgi:ferredoxin
VTYVVTEDCVNCRHTTCVTVYPVACFKSGANFLVIHPEECIDCGVCVPECPVNAIYAEGEVPPNQRHFIALNAELSRVWPTITELVDPLPQADHWKNQPGKTNLIVR